MKKCFIAIAALFVVNVASSQELIVDGGFDKPFEGNKIETKGDDYGIWYTRVYKDLADKCSFTLSTDDEKGGVVLIKSAENTVWYKSYIAQMIKKPESLSPITVSLDAKAVGGNATVRVFVIAVDKTGATNKYLATTGYDIDNPKQQNMIGSLQSKRVNSKEWSHLSFSFNPALIINSTYSVNKLKSSGKVMISTPADEIEKYIVAIQLASGNSTAMVDNVSVVQE